MTYGPEDPNAVPPPPEGEPTPPPYAPAPQPGYGYPAGPYGASPQAPYGVDPKTGLPFSDKQKLVAGLLQIFLGGFGVGRFYIGDTKIGVWQLVVTILTCGIGSLWGFVDGIIMLASDSKDVNGLPLRS
jgi:TM2 domain-containing membrane protein YozV